MSNQEPVNTTTLADEWERLEVLERVAEPCEKIDRLNVQIAIPGSGILTDESGRRFGIVEWSPTATTHGPTTVKCSLVVLEPNP